MRKFNYYMAAFVFAAGVSASLTSCIDTEEPDGIKSLREAKAGFINAETALKQADVAYREAETAYKQVETAIKKVEQLTDELTLAQKQAVQDITIEAEIEAKKLELENAKEDLNEAISNNAEALARVKRQNAESLAELAAFGDGAMRTAYEAMLTAQDDYADALEDLADAQKDLAKELARTSADDKADFQSDIELAEIGVAAAEKVKADFEELTANKDEAAWVAEWKEYDEAVAAADVKVNQLQLQIDKLSDQQTDADQAVSDAKDAIKQVRTDYEDAVIELAVKVENPSLAELIESAWSLSYSDVMYTSTGGFYYNFDEKTITYDVDAWGGDELQQKNIKGVAEELRDDIIKPYADTWQHLQDVEDYKDLTLSTTYVDNLDKVNGTDNGGNNAAKDNYLKEWQDQLAKYRAATKEADRYTELATLKTKSIQLFGGTDAVLAIPTPALLGKDDWAAVQSLGYNGPYIAVEVHKENLAKIAKQNAAYDDAVRIVNELDAMVEAYGTEDAKLLAEENAALEGEEVAKLQEAADKLQEQIDALSDEQTAINKVKGYQDAYKTTIEGFLTSIDGFDADANSISFALNDEQLDKKIAETLVWLNNDIEKAKNAVERAKYNQKLFLDGDYAEAYSTSIKDAQDAVDVAQDAVDQAKKDLDEATAKYEAIKAKFAE